MLKHTFTYSNARINVYHVNKNEGLPKHEHIYNHAVLCNAGSCIVRLEGKELTMTKNTQPINLPAGKWHEILALENDTVFLTVFQEGSF